MKVSLEPLSTFRQIENFINLFFKIPDEELIKWGFPEDVWFHVDKMSSAHVYLRLQKVKDPQSLENFALIHFSRFRAKTWTIFLILF